MKLTLFKKSKNSHKKAYKQKVVGEERAKHDWFILVTIFIGLIVVVFGFDAYLFLRINQGNFFVADTVVQDNETVMTKKVLLDAQNFFNARQKEYDAFTATPSAEIDPS